MYDLPCHIIAAIAIAVSIVAKNKAYFGLQQPTPTGM